MIAAAGLLGGASLLGGALGGKGAAKAAKIQAQSYREGIQSQQRQFEQQRADFAPIREAGYEALGGMGGLLGLDGADAQAKAIAALKGSPGFTALYDQGVDTILQNASATGGLRGGNVNGSLAQFGSGLLSQTIQNQLANLGGIASLGAGAVNQGAQIGQQNANTQAQLMGAQGNALGAAAGAPWLGLANGLSGAVQAITGLGALGGFGGRTAAPASSGFLRLPEASAW